MRAFVVGFVLCVLTVTGVMARPAPDSFADLTERLMPAVVNISTTQKVSTGGAIQLFPFGNDPQMEPFKDFFERFGGQGAEPLDREVTSLGSGFIIAAEGYVVTNHHVIAEAEEINVILHDDTKLAAEIVGRDPKTDLALLKVEGDRPLPFVSFGDSDKIRVGDWVMAIGNPFGLGGTVTAGIISARARNINAGPFDDFLQTDAAINRGNSGGPMFNMDGEVIGINSAIFSPTGGNVGIGFAVPSALAQPVIQQLKEMGRTQRGWLGVKIQHVTEEIADSVGLAKPMGALVLEVDEDGPAKPAGILPGDVIVRFDGKEIEEMRFLPRIVAETKIDTKVDVVVWRDEKETRLSVTLGELDESEELAKYDTPDASKKDTDDKATQLTMFGMGLAPLTPKMRDRFGIDDAQTGLIVLDVKRNGEAARRGIRYSDVIAMVNNEEVKSTGDFTDALADAKSDGRKHALIRVIRGENTLFLTLPVEEKPSED